MVFSLPRPRQSIRCRITPFRRGLERRPEKPSRGGAVPSGARQSKLCKMVHTLTGQSTMIMLHLRQIPVAGLRRLKRHAERPAASRMAHACQSWTWGQASGEGMEQHLSSADTRQYSLESRLSYGRTACGVTLVLPIHLRQQGSSSAHVRHGRETAACSKSWSTPAHQKSTRSTRAGTCFLTFCMAARRSGSCWVWANTWMGSDLRVHRPL